MPQKCSIYIGHPFCTRRSLSKLTYPTLHEFQERISENIEKFPWVACELGGLVEGNWPPIRGKSFGP